MSWIKNNLTALIAFAVAILTTLQVMKDFGLVSDLQFASFVAGSAAAILVPLAKGPWAGALKTSLDLAGGLLVVAIPFVAMWVGGTAVTHQDVILMILAGVKVLATEFGVQVRTDWGATSPSKLINAGVAPADAISPAPVITTLPTNAVDVSGGSATAVSATPLAVAATSGMAPAGSAAGAAAAAPTTSQ